METNDFQELLRELAIRMRNFQVCEGMDSLTAELCEHDGNSEGTARIYNVTLKGTRLTITYAGSRQNNVTVYSGPINWLKGSINYDKPLDEQ